MRKVIVLMSLVSCALYSSAQVETYQINDWLGSSQWNYNPALQSKEKVFVYLPGLAGFSLKAGHTGFSYNDAISDNQLDITNLIDGLEDQNHILGEMNSTLFAFGVKSGNVQLRAGVSAHNQSRLTYTKGLLELAWKGNGHPDLIGQRVSMDGTAVNSVIYLNYFVGGSVSLLDNKLNLGLNANFYNGVASSYTESSAFGIRTNENNYYLTLDGSYDQKTSGGETFEDIDPAAFQPFSVEGNKGIGFDFGLTYKVTDKFSVDASAMNVGKIDWTQSIENFQLENQEITYQGFELNDFISDADSAQSSIEQFTDSIADLFVPNENKDEFSTIMNNQIFLRGVYDFSDKSRLSAFVNSRNSFGTNFTSAGALYSRNFGRTLRLSGGLQMFRMKDVLVPIGLVLNAGPIQLGLHTENILAVINPNGTKHLSGAFSIGLRFGKDKD